MPLIGYLKIDDIPGESQRVDHEDEIDVFDLEWGVERRGSAQVGRGRARARAEISPLVLHKLYDASSPYLAQASSQGKSFRDMTLSVRKDSGEAHLDYLVITMENVIVRAYDIVGARDGSDQLEEVIELEFESAKIVYTVQADDHSAGAEHEVEVRA